MYLCIRHVVILFICVFVCSLTEYLSVIQFTVFSYHKQAKCDMPNLFNEHYYKLHPSTRYQKKKMRAQIFGVSCSKTDYETLFVLISKLFYKRECL